MTTAQTGKSRATRKSPPIAKARSSTPAAPAVKVPSARKFAPASDTWREMVATAAYFRAQARGFAHGSPEQDWLAAEAELKLRFGEVDKT